MKKLKISLILLSIIFLFSGCTAQMEEPPIKEYDGAVSVISDKVVDAYYVPTFVGNVALSYLPDSIKLSVAGEEFDAEIKSVSLSFGFYVIGFKIEHMFSDVDVRTYTIDVIVINGKDRVKLENYGTFKCTHSNNVYAPDKEWEILG